MGTYQSKYTGLEIDNGLNPVGTIISFMGTIAPEGFLICDGSELNIANYPKLASHFETQFGSKNHFGGDGTTTFAVPDLRNEFLRGYGDLSGEIGAHQDGTAIPHITIPTSDKQLYIRYPYEVQNPDKSIGESVGYVQHGANYTYTSAGNPTGHIVRPTNVAVLYCIKY